MYNLRQQLLKVAALLLPLRLGSSPVQQDDLAASPVLAAVEGGHRDLGGVRGGGGELEQGGGNQSNNCLVALILKNNLVVRGCHR